MTFYAPSIRLNKAAKSDMPGLKYKIYITYHQDAVNNNKNPLKQPFCAQFPVRNTDECL